LSKKVKIVLVVSVCLLVAIIGVVVFGKKSSDQSATPAGETQTTDDIYAPDTTTYPDETVAETTTETASPNASQSVSATQSTTTIASKASITPSRTPTQYVRITNKDMPTVTPYPNSGYFDWTRKPADKPLDVSITKSDLDKIKTNDICKMANVSDSWNDPFNKMLCSFLKFSTDQVLDPLNVLMCNLQTSALNLNYGSNIIGELVGSTCQIQDR